MKPIKLIVSNKSKLQWKYGKNFPKITSILKKMQLADKSKGFDTKIVYVDNAVSLKSSGVKKIKTDSENEYKRVVDDLYTKYLPAYIVILGSQDIVPFQEIDNPAEDEDPNVPSDLPYACDTTYSSDINNFTGPSRVVGRIPDKMGKQKDIRFIEKIIINSLKHVSKNAEEYHNYFSLSALVWKKSTELSLQNMFGQAAKMITSPNNKTGKRYKSFTKKQLEPLTHFYNCHGANFDLSFYGQKEDEYPEAVQSANLSGNIKPGTIVAAECCYGGQLFDNEQMSYAEPGIVLNYFANDAIAFLGSSTIAYGPADSQGLADLITQYFIKNVLKGASIGRAFLEARQRFLTEAGPDLDPQELKTIAQFYLLGDPSIQPVEDKIANIKTLSAGSAIANSRKNLSMKGFTLGASIGITSKEKTDSPLKVRMTRSGDITSISIDQILANNNFTRVDKTAVYSVQPKLSNMRGMQKNFGDAKVKFHTYIQNPMEKIKKIRVLIVKENDAEILGWKVYESK